MTKSICFIFAAGLALAAVASAEVSNDGETFAEATAFVQSFSSMNAQGDSACLKVANDAIKVIADECKTLQVVINTAAQANQKCCKSGSVATCSAKSQHANAVTAHSTCLSQLANIKKKTVNLGTVSYSSLAGKPCYNHNSNSAFQAIKNEVTQKTTECNKKSGSKASAKKTYDDAVKAAASSRTTCNRDGQTALTKAFAKGKAACGSATNLKAFKRAEHMKCVLKGTKLADCSKNMPKPPAVKETTLSTLKCAVQTGHTTQCRPLRKGVKIIGSSLNDTLGTGGSSCHYGGHKGLKVNWRCSSGKIALYSMKGSTMGGSEWKKYKFSCPKGWRWAKYAEFMAVARAHGCHNNNAKSHSDGSMSTGGASGGKHTYYNTCGWNGYNASPVGGDSNQQMFIFSDSYKNNNCEHSGNYIGMGGPCSATIVNELAGISCIKV